MSEHDEEQPPAAPGRPRIPSRPWAGSADAPAGEAASPWASPGRGRPFPGEPWASPGQGRPFPGEPWAAEPPPAPTEPVFSYPHDGYPPPPSQAGTPPYGSPYAAPPAYPRQGPAYPVQGPTYPVQGPTYPVQGPTYPGSAPTYPGSGGAGWPAGGWQGGWGAPQEGPPGSWPPPPSGLWGPTPGPWAPPPPDAPPKGNNPLTIIIVAILVATLIGLGIGSQLVSGRATIGSAPNFFPTTQPPSSVGPSGSGGLSPARAQAIAGAVDPSVVDINTKLGFQRASAAGTGMVLTSDGQVLTNNHVVAGATSMTAMVVGGKSYTAHVLGTDPTEDVALIKLEGASGLVPIKTGDPTKLSTGDPIVAVGNAGGVGGTPSVVTGTVVALDQSVTASDLGGGNTEQLSGMIEINAPLQPGDSGGPLINASSQVVGMDTAASASSRVESQSSVGFAIPITRAIAIAQQIAAGQASATIQIGLPGFLGVSVAANNPAGNGAAISGILPASPAQKAGLASGDVITSVNGQPVGSQKALTAILQQRHPGDKVVIGWIDPAGKSHSATVTLTTGPAA